MVYQYIKHKRKKRIANKLIIHPLYENNDTDNSKNKTPSPTLSPSPGPPANSPSNRSTNSKDCIVNLKTGEKQFTVASKTQESEYSFFQQNQVEMKKPKPTNVVVVVEAKVDIKVVV